MKKIIVLFITTICGVSIWASELSEVKNLSSTNEDVLFGTISRLEEKPDGTRNFTIDISGMIEDERNLSEIEVAASFISFLPSEVLKNKKNFLAKNLDILFDDYHFTIKEGSFFLIGSEYGKNGENVARIISQTLYKLIENPISGWKIKKIFYRGEGQLLFDKANLYLFNKNKLKKRDIYYRRPIELVPFKTVFILSILGLFSKLVYTYPEKSVSILRALCEDRLSRLGAILQDEKNLEKNEDRIKYSYTLQKNK